MITLHFHLRSTGTSVVIIGDLLEGQLDNRGLGSVVLCRKAGRPCAATAGAYCDQIEVICVAVLHTCCLSRGSCSRVMARI